MVFAIWIVAALGLFCVLACLFALLKGGAAERLGASIILANLLAGTANQLLLHNDILDLSIDGVTALVLLAVAVRYASAWLGAVMLVFALQFGLHAFYFVLERKPDDLQVIVNDADTVAISLALLAGTLVASRRRRRELGAGAALPEAAP